MGKTDPPQELDTIPPLDVPTEEPDIPPPGKPPPPPPPDLVPREPRQKRPPPPPRDTRYREPFPSYPDDAVEIIPPSAVAKPSPTRSVAGGPSMVVRRPTPSAGMATISRPWDLAAMVSPLVYPATPKR